MNSKGFVFKTNRRPSVTGHWRNLSQRGWVGMICVIGCLAAGMVGCGGEDAPLWGQRGQAATTHRVAALQYASGKASQVSPDCASAAEPDVCAVAAMVEQAQADGALLVVAPELALGQTYYEPQPSVGDNPAEDSSWDSDSFIKIFSQQAKELQIYLVIHVITAQGLTKRSTQVALGPDGAVVGVHHKFELFGSEGESYTPGEDVTVFDTPLGKVGLLICADIYGDLQLHRKLAEDLGARVLAFSSYWTATGAARWQASFAKNWGLYVVASNTASGPGVGGGVFEPDGTALVQEESATPSITAAEIPAP